MVTGMRMLHDSRSELFRSPGGAQPCGETVRLCLRVDGETPETVYLRQWFGKESYTPMARVDGDPTLYEARIRLPDTPVTLWYDFQVISGGQFYWYGNADDLLGGEGAQVYGQARSYQITVYDPAFRAPDWTRGAVFYQIFPDRFARDARGVLPMDAERHVHRDWNETPLWMIDPASGDNVAHDFFGGTLRGIAEKLPYIASLGVTALYLNPIFDARTNHRFDTNDWHAIDPALGTEDDFIRLCAAAEGMGIRIILDGVFSHSGASNPFFLDAQQNPDSPYRNWYHFEHWPDMYKSWWGFRTLPEIDKRQPAVVRYFLTGENAVVRRWLGDGASGWRIDVADELPMPFLSAMRRAIKAEKGDALIIGEVWEDASNKLTYGQMRNYCLGDTLDGVMNYPLRLAAIDFLLGAIDSHGFARRMASLYENYPPPFAASLLNVIGSHDRARTINVLAGAEGAELPRPDQACHVMEDQQRRLGIRRLRLMLQIIVSMPGMPCVYYGDEAGMTGCADPFNRGTFPWGKEDQALTAYFRKALRRRREVAALTDGKLAFETPGPDVLCIRREGNGRAAHTVVNRSNRARKVEYRGQMISVPAYEAVVWEA